MLRVSLWLVPFILGFGELTFACSWPAAVIHEINNQSIVQFSLRSRTTVVATQASMIVPVECTDEPNIFIINQRHVDLSQFEDEHEFRVHILKLLPTKIGKVSLWLGTARALDVPTDGDDRQKISDKIADLIELTHDKEICSKVDDFVETCNEMMALALIYDEKVLTKGLPPEGRESEFRSDDPKILKDAIDAIEPLIAQLYQIDADVSVLTTQLGGSSRNKRLLCAVKKPDIDSDKNSARKQRMVTTKPGKAKPGTNQSSLSLLQHSDVSECRKNLDEMVSMFADQKESRAKQLRRMFGQLRDGNAPDKRGVPWKASPQREDISH